MSGFDINSMYRRDNGIGLQNLNGYDGNAVNNISPIRKTDYTLGSATSLTENGLADTFGNMFNKPKTDGSNPLFDMFGSEKSLNSIQGLGALGSLGLGLAGFLSNQKMLKKQGALMDQQLANNAIEMQRRTNTLDYYNKEGAAMKDKLNAMPQSNPLRPV